MTTADPSPPELFKLGSHEYLAYACADHAEHPPSSIGVRLERHGNPKFSICCTASFVRGKLGYVQTPDIGQADSYEERMTIRLFYSSPELQGFVRDWIECCYRRYETKARQTRAA
jgi:hypothetical protein